MTAQGPDVILVTGAFRGIGRGMFDHYVAQPNKTVIAAVRDVDRAKVLLDVPRGNGTKVLLIKIDSASKTDPYDAVKDLQSKGVESVDVVISAAGIAPLNTIEDLPLDEFEHVLQVNAISVMLLYKATLPLMRRAGQTGRPVRFAFISASGGSLTTMQDYPYPNVSYGASKAMANYIVVKMGMENDWLTSLCIHPGYASSFPTARELSADTIHSLVQTDMGNKGAIAFGLEKAPITLDDSSRNTAHIIENSTKADHDGKFFNCTIDKIHPW